MSPVSHGKGSRQANSKGVRREAESEGSCRQPRGPTNRNRIRGIHTCARRKRNPKPDSHPEGGEVDAAGRWEEGRASYPGRSVDLPRATGAVRGRDGSAEVSRGRRSRNNRPAKGRTCREAGDGICARPAQVPRKRAWKPEVAG